MGMEIGIVNLENSMDIPETNKNKNWTTKSCHMINQFHFWIYIYISPIDTAKALKNSNTLSWLKKKKKHPTKER